MYCMVCEGQLFPCNIDEKQDPSDHAELPQYPDPALALTECFNLLSSGDW